MFAMAKFIQAIIILLLTVPTSSFILRNVAHQQRCKSSKCFSTKKCTNDLPMKVSMSRRDAISVTLLNIGITLNSSPVWAATRESLADLLYRIIRVREATVMETRLIKTGNFKDVQRANIKLAVRFMVENYRLNDAFVAASTYLDGGNRRLEASQLGQSATQNLVTILEYFDAADVQNLKVGESTLSGKEELVLKGLDAARRNIDDFLSFFPKADVDTVVARVNDENDANVKEFDGTLGPLLNMPKSV